MPSPHGGYGPSPGGPVSGYWADHTPGPPQDGYWPAGNQQEEPGAREERYLRLELDIGGKWVLRTGLFFIILGLFIWGYFIKRFEPWEKALLFFVCGAGMLGLGEHIYVKNRKIFQHYISQYGVWLVMGGVQVMYLGAWRTYSVYHLTDFRYFVLLILLILMANVALSIRHAHPLMNLQYLTTFSMVCLAVFAEYPPSDPYFTLLFLSGTAGILITDSRWRATKHAALTLGYSSILLAILLGETQEVTPYLLTGYLAILIWASLRFRDADIFPGIGRIPDLFWGCILVLGYLHSLHFLLTGTEGNVGSGETIEIVVGLEGGGVVFAAIFAFLTLGMLCTYYAPVLAPGMVRREGKGAVEGMMRGEGKYRFATDLEFFFITGMFFLVFVTITSHWLLLPPLLITASIIAGINLTRRYDPGDGIPQLLDAGEFFMFAPGAIRPFLLKNRIRAHVFLVCISLAAIIGLVWMNVPRITTLSYIIGFSSMTAVFATILYRRSEEDALMEVRTPVPAPDGGVFPNFEMAPNSHVMDRGLNLHLPGTAVLFWVVCLSLLTDLSVTPLIPFSIFLAVTLLLNVKFAEDLRRVITRSGIGIDISGGAQISGGASREAIRGALKGTWSGPDTEMMTRFAGALIFMGLMAGLTGMLVPGRASALFLLFLGLAVILTKEGEYTRKRSFLLDRIGDAGEYRGLLYRSGGYLLFIPFVLLILSGQLRSAHGIPFEGYGYLVLVLMIGRWLFPDPSPVSYGAHVLTLIILGLLTWGADHAGFVFILGAGLILYLDREWIGGEWNIRFAVPLLFLYTVRGIMLLQDLVVRDIIKGGVPPFLALLIEALVLVLFLARCREIARGNGAWTPPDRGTTHTIHPDLLVLLALLPAAQPQLHAAVILIPLGILYLGLRSNAIIETFISFSILFVAVFHLLSLITSDAALEYILILFLSLFLAIAIMLDRSGRGNDASMGLFAYSCLALLGATAVTFSGGASTTGSWVVMAFLIIMAGISLEKRYMRFAGMGVAGLTVLKILIYDLIEAPVWTRVGSLIVAGFSFLCIAYLYVWYREKVARERGWSEDASVPMDGEPDRVRK